MDENLAKKIGLAARASRTALGLTQADAAERVGINSEFYARIERGQTLPSVPTLAALADALGVSADRLLGSAGPSARTDEPAPARSASDSPAMRRLQRRLRGARPRTIRLLGLLAAALEADRKRRPRAKQRRR